MKYLIDTDIASYYLRGKDNLFDIFKSKGFSNIKLSIVTVAELEVLAHRNPSSRINFEAINGFAQVVEVLDVNQSAWKLFSATKASLLTEGRRRGDLDILQASLAITHGLVVITNNTRHYIDIVDSENWSEN